MINTNIDIFLGLNVGKTDHWACTVTKDGKKIWNKTLPNDEAKLIAVYQNLTAQGTVLVVVDQSATIGALAVAVAQQLGIQVAYLPGLTMRRIADMYPGTAKTDEKDAFIIADAARTMPHTLRSLQLTDEEEAALGMLTGFDLDLARQITQTSNRIRGLFTQIHPPLERLLGPRLDYDAILEVLAAWPTPAALKHAGKARIDAKLKKHGARRHTAWAAAIMDALDEQSVIVVGTDAAGLVIPHMARQLISLHAQRADVATHLETMVEAHPLYPVLTSMPGVAVRTAAIIIASDLRQELHQCCSTGFLRWIGTDHAPVRDLNQVRARQPFREQTIETGALPLGVRVHPFRSNQPGILRPETSPG